MIYRKTHNRIILGVVLVGVMLAGASSIVLAQDTAKLVEERCTECHTADRWKNKKKTEKQWTQIIDEMVRYGAQLNDSEAGLTVEYLTAMSQGKIKQPTTTTTKVRPKPVVTTTVEGKDANALKTTTTVTEPPTTTTSVTPTTVLAEVVTPPVDSVPGEQAETGVEMVWYLLGGGMLLGSGISLRNKDKQLDS